MSYQLMAWASEQVTGSHTRKAVLMALANAANHHSGRCTPSVERICSETELGPTAVKRALKDLSESGLIARARNRRDDGSLGTYSYSFSNTARGDLPESRGDSSAPQMTTDARRLAEPGTDLDQKQDLEPDPPVAPPLGQWRVDRKPVTLDEGMIAKSVLAEWNALTRQTLRSRDWLAKIVMRVRERPELGVDEHAHIIRVALKAPWWKGEASPAVVYGNGALFEQQLMQAAKGNVGGSQGAFEIALKIINETRRAS